MKPLHEVSGKSHSKIQPDVLLKRSQPVALCLSRQSPAAVPYTFAETMTEPLHDNNDRCPVPGPAVCRPDRIYTAAIRTAITLQIHKGLISINPDPYIPMPPYPIAPAAFSQTMFRPWVAILPDQMHYLLDTDHQKKRQYPVPSRSGGGLLIQEKANSPLRVLSSVFDTG